ncbi:MAG: glycosyltransferase family 1 protein [Caldilineae bacterium]|nr:MAG: glycosyltransferase family 1 protein [Caldilineae bacterium]
MWLYMDYEEMFRGRPIELWLLKHAPPWFAHVVAISEAGRRDVRRNTGVQASVVHLGLFHPGELVARRSPLPPSPRRVMYVGDSRPRKGLQDFLAAAEQVFRQMPDVKLVIVSKEKCRIETSVPFEFHHFPSRRVLGELYRRSHLFVSASWAEGLGYPPLEAMACGTPVVLTNSRGVLDFARPGENCLMVPPRRPDALAEAMLRLLADPALAERFAAAGLQTAQRFNWRTSVEKMEAILQSVVKGGV